MNEPAEAQAFRVVERGGPAGRVVLRRQGRDADHWVVHQKPALVNALIRRFLAESRET